MTVLIVRRVTHPWHRATDPRSYANFTVMRNLAYIVEFGDAPVNPVGGLVGLSLSPRPPVFWGKSRVAVLPGPGGPRCP